MSAIDITIVDARSGGDGGGSAIDSAVASTGLVTAQQPAMLSNLAYTNQVSSNDLAAKAQLSNQDAMNRLRLGILARAVDAVQRTGPLTARSSVEVVSANEAAQDLADLRSAASAATGRRVLRR